MYLLIAMHHAHIAYRNEHMIADAGSYPLHEMHEEYTPSPLDALLVITAPLALRPPAPFVHRS